MRSLGPASLAATCLALADVQAASIFGKGTGDEAWSLLLDLESGDAAGPCGLSSCTYPSPDQIEDTSVWGNTVAGQPAEPWVDDRGVVRTVIQEGRDLFPTKRPGCAPYAYPHPLTVPGAMACP